MSLGWRRLLILVCMVASAVIAIILPQPGVVPTGGVDGDRLREDLNFVASQPHPPGSADHAIVRNWMLAELTALGLSPRVDEAEGLTRFGQRVELKNIVARVEGTSDLPAVLVATHYDSRSETPGAGDATMAVVSLLETARKLRDQPPRRDVILLWTDGEESGLLGAFAWVEQHPDFEGASHVLNFDARGNAGPPVMFQSSGDVAQYMNAFAAAPWPVGNSAAAFIYEKMPNNTDYTVFSLAGLTGLNFAVVDGFEHYHMASDTPSNLGDGMLRRYAATMWRATDTLANEPLLREGGNRSRAYFNAGPLIVQYGSPLAWTTLALASLFLGWVAAGRAYRIDYCTLLRRLVETLLALGLTLPLLWLDRGKAWAGWTPALFGWAVLVVVVVTPDRTMQVGHLRRGWLVVVGGILLIATIALLAWDLRPSFLTGMPLLGLVVAAWRPTWAIVTLAASWATLVLLPMLWLGVVALTFQMLVVFMPGLLLLAWLWQIAWQAARESERRAKRSGAATRQGRAGVWPTKSSARP